MNQFPPLPLESIEQAAARVRMKSAGVARVRDGQGFAERVAREFPKAQVTYRASVGSYNVSWVVFP